MLQNLHVKNLALIDEAEVELSYGMNVLSGETGAGKSIIIGSINLALGEKVPKEMLRDNDETALVELIFQVDNPKTIAKLKELDVEMTDDTVILSRKISGGRAIARVNGEAVSASALKEIAGLLIDIHGQNEHQSLLSKRKHLEILDEYAKKEIAPLKAQVSEIYHTYKKQKAEWDASNIDSSERERERSLLEYEVRELEDAKLTIGEDEELEASFRKFSNGKKIMEGLNLAYGLTGGDMESASAFVGRAVRELSSVTGYDEEVDSLYNQLMEIDSLIGDFNHDISGYIDNADFDGEAFYQIEKRLDFINHLKSKYGNTIEKILEEQEKKTARMEKLLDYDSYLADLEKNLKETESALEESCENLSKARKKAALIFTEEVKKALEDLNFLDVQFEMEFLRAGAYTENGFDDPEFLISTNPGENLKPLGKVASGGEMSRIMLAIKTVMAETDDIESLIFDEIDSGISGRTAQMVAEKMNLLSRNHQIIVITHLPQIAAMADSHFLIEKSVDHQSTKTHIHKLKEAESVSELARMLGGVEITDTVLQNAREMKEMAFNKK